VWRLPLMVVAQAQMEVTAGRDAEIELARQALAAVAGGSSSTVLVEGEAGVGKSHLMGRIRAEAVEMGLQVVTGGSRVLERGRPFGLIADAFDLRATSEDGRRAAIGRLLLPDERASRPADERFRVVDEIVELVQSDHLNRPLVVVLEDLHWTDESSLMAIRAVVHELAHLPLLLTATYRPSPRSAELDLLIDEFGASGARLVPLSPLSADEVDILVAAELGATAGPLLCSIVARANGNPLLVVELLRSLSAEGWLRHDGRLVEAAADELPRTLRDLVLRRLRYLPPGVLDVLRLAAVLGESASIHDLAAAAGQTPVAVVADLAEAFRGRLLDESGEVVAFRHQLVQQAIYEDLPVTVRRALHRDVAGSLARVGAPSSKVASHLLLGADCGDLEAVRWLRRAAAEATPGSPSVGVELTRRAFELLPLGHSDADVVSSELAAAMMRSGQVADAAQVAAEVLGRPHRDDVDVPLKLTLVDALSLQNRGPELIARAERALASPNLRPADRALVLTQLSYGKTFSGDLVGGEAAARQALVIAEQARSTEMTVWSLCAASVSTKTQGRYVDAVSLATRASQLAFEPLDLGARLRNPYFFAGMALADSDRFEEARIAYGRAIDEASELGTAWLLPDMLSLAGELRFVCGEWDDAGTELEAATRLAERHGQRISIPQNASYRALIAAARADTRTARALLAGLEDTLHDKDPPYGTEMIAFAVANMAEADGDTHGAFGVLLQVWNHDVERQNRYYHRYLAPPLVRLAAAVDRVDIAEDVVDAVEEGAELAPDVLSVRGNARRCRGLLDRDPDVLIDAVHWMQLGGRVLDHAGTCEDAAVMLRAVGRQDEAKGVLLEALDVYDGLDAVAASARVAATLRTLGVRRGARGTRHHATQGWASLTPSERAVSELVAEGLTNRDVARRLHISPHTVNTHLRHVFQKLTVSTRAELAASVARRIANNAIE
jgi:DNA-binding CsgD family transcriptional regulator